jgi:hypothetical protein
MKLLCFDNSTWHSSVCAMPLKLSGANSTVWIFKVKYTLIVPPSDIVNIPDPLFKSKLLKANQVYLAMTMIILAEDKQGWKFIEMGL